MCASHSGYHRLSATWATTAGSHVVMQQNQIEIGIRQQFASAETTHGDDGKPTIRFDAQFGPLGGQPEFVQIDQCMSQRGGVEPPVLDASGE